MCVCRGGVLQPVLLLRYACPEGTCTTVLLSAMRTTHTLARVCVCLWKRFTKKEAKLRYKETRISREFWFLAQGPESRREPCASGGMCGRARHAPQPQRREEMKLKGSLKIDHTNRFSGVFSVRWGGLDFPWDSHGQGDPKASFTQVKGEKSPTIFVTTPHSCFCQWGRKGFVPTV